MKIHFISTILLFLAVNCLQSDELIIEPGSSPDADLYEAGCVDSKIDAMFTVNMCSINFF